MNNWPEMMSAYRELATAVRNGADASQPWRRFAAAAEASRDDPPYHLRPLLRILQRLNLPPDRIRLLEHGYGSGKSLLYLLALGYRGIYGVDIGADCAPWNKFFADTYGMSEPRFFSYDGSTLPFADRSFDLVFSQQVLEHVTPDLLEHYCAEEGRVLRPGGIAYHQIPHRLVPYESHTLTWFVHYAPRPVALRLYGLMKRDVSFVRNYLFFRSRGTYAAMFRRHIGLCEDVSVERLMCDRVEGEYDGPARLRRGLSKLFALPVAGRFFAAAAKNFMMAELVATKRRR